MLSRRRFSEALNTTALFALPGFLLYVLTAIYCIVYSLRRTVDVTTDRGAP
jgi:hypothetical protein